MIRKPVGRTFAVPDTVESLYNRALRADASPEDHSWPTVMYYRGAIDRKERGKMRVFHEHEYQFKESYNRGWNEMERLTEKESYEAKTS